ncbi:LacI family DNA-binding transcriptional regulator [Pseudarthrobacter equi]|uniref:LacI family DNA-binding transcriptional regulator n=1 Tax=Pseudarthrobacter equi TaxID=728066 RepID=UPI0021BED3B0|nr:LacI family DNA-binding transcriptional regulator [Pseudarthrobacter equi]MCT9627222.1 LacI family DNA-binding transcriptional regulator [Pseudarthrobacter equi]
MNVTVKDVARAAGVSTATVSRALRNFESVDPVTRSHVWEVANQLGYVGSSAAQALSTGKAGSVGIITPYVDRWSFGRLLSGIEREMRAASIDLLVYCTGNPRDTTPLHRRLGRRVDGFLILSSAATSPDLEELLKLRMPVTMIGNSAPWTSSVRIDDRGAAVSATGHLIGQGHKRIGLIHGGEKANPLVLEHRRYLGYSAAMEGAALPVDESIQASGEFTVTGGERAMTQLLETANPPTAVFALSDEMAFGAIRSLKGRGLQPGVDVAINGFDGHDMSELMDLTTVYQPLELMGATAAQNLLADLRDPSRERATIVLPTQLVPRGSTGAGPATMPPAG